LRAGAGLVTVACSEAMLAAIAPELMTEPWPGNPQRKDVVALGPGLGAEPANVEIARHAAATFDQPMVIDADGLNALAGTAWSAGGKFRVLTPHPGEMSRLAGKTTREVQEDRIGVARSFD